MDFRVTIKLDNAAFTDDDGELDREELAQVVAFIAESIRDENVQAVIRDVNGNAVGTWVITA